MKLYNIGFFELIPDIINCFFFGFLFLFFFKKYKINSIFLFISIISLAFPFLIYFLWDWSYLPDQSKYAHSVYNIRNFNYEEIAAAHLFDRVFFASVLMALFPIPFVNTIISVSIINKSLLLLSIFIFLKNKMVPNALIFLLLLSPSYIVISSLALRDLLVILSSIMFAYYFFKNKKILKTFFFLILIFFLKPHLAIYIIIISLAYYWFFNFNIKLINKFIISLFLSIFLFYVILKLWYIFENIRFGFISETLNYTLNIKSFNDEPKTIFLFLFSFIEFVLLPISKNIFTLKNFIIFFENFIFIFYYFFYLIRIYKNNKFKAVFWIIILLFTSTLAGYLVHNEGTLWRYKIILQTLLLFLIYFDLNNTLKKNNLGF